MDVAERLAAPLRKGEVFKQLCEDMGVEFDYSRTYECMAELRARIAKEVGGGWRYNFPPDKAHAGNSLEQDLKDAAGEIAEAAVELGCSYHTLTAMEILDAVHVLESALRKIEAQGIDLDELKDSVIKKNRARGYYGGEE